MDLGIVSGGASRQVALTGSTKTRHLVPADTAASTTSASVQLDV